MKDVEGNRDKNDAQLEDRSTNLDHIFGVFSGGISNVE
jgi:hypothetical protein